MVPTSNFSWSPLTRFQEKLGLLEVLSLCFLASLIIFPNVFRIEKAIAAILLIIFTLSYVRLSRFQVLVFLAGFAITETYLIVGLLRGASDLAVYYVTLVYIVSPIFWLLFSSALLRLYGIERLVSLLILLGFIAACTVPIFWFVFTNYGVDLLSLFIENPNVFVDDDGVISIRMHVYGSLIFLVPAFFAYTSFKEINFNRGLIAAVLLFSSLISGRSALLLSAIIGLIAWCGLKIRYQKTLKINWEGIVISLFIIVAVLFSFAALNIEFSSVFSALYEKLNDFGGYERKNQFVSLLDGIEDVCLLGQGHGIPSYVIRNNEMPWKYELLLLSSIFHVGLLGALVYAVPLFYVLCKAHSFLCKGSINKTVATDMFFLFGMLSITFASATNPYLLSAEFQWMWFLPFVYFSDKAFHRKKFG